MIKVFTIEREYGSQGAELAHRLAERLNWKLVDRCLIDEIAHKAGVSKSMAEQCDEAARSLVLPDGERVLAWECRPASRTP